ncbi:unnamed protein product [Urochloa decumbens]|uniref:GATA-type domain-containing protein n=1 Tax=Urochloa decumbens TaxID=240449 RepID=A0ABC9F3R0_9POAL
MLHQTLIPSSFPPSVSASSSSPFLHASDAATPPPGGSSSSAALPRGSAMPSLLAHHHSPLDDARMDTLKCNNSFSPEETTEAADPAAAAGVLVEKDGFSVEDLLDLEEFGEPDKDGADNVQAPPTPPSGAAEVKSNEDSQQLSVVTYELPPPPPPEMVGLPAHDVEELEWVSRIMDDSLSELPPQPQPSAALLASLAARPPLAHQRRAPTPHAHGGGVYRALPPAPGLPLRTPAICALSTEAPVPVKAKRSKRARGPGWSRSGASFLSDSASSTSTATTSSSSSSGSFSSFLFMDAAPFAGLDPPAEGYYNHHYFLPAPPSKKSKHGGGGKGGKPKKRGRKPKNPPSNSAAAGGAAASQQPAPGDRRCSHCGVNKTPQWRAGPAGAKTLCNACGVRYKSGRLLPEYRPACSPTFVSTIHSNSHRKVLEMRRKKEGGMVATAAPAVASF